MNHLGLDQSLTSTGYYIIGKSSELIDVGVYRTDKEDNTFVRVLNIRNKIMDIIHENNVTSVSIEGLAFGMRGNATRDLAGLQFMIVCAIIDAKLPMAIHSPLSVKKFATGNGKAKKIDMYESLPSEIQRLFTDDRKFLKTKGLYDVTDAYFIAMMRLTGNQLFNVN